MGSEFSVLSSMERTSPGRRAAEQFVQEAYGRKHGAQVSSFMPTLLALNRGSHLCGVVGYRLADQEALYLEQYLDQPIEIELATRLGTTVSRQQIAEIGNFAGSSCRTGRYLLTLLPRHLAEHGLTWVVFTATSLIRDILQSVAAPVVEVCHADSQRVVPGDAWGDYYTMDPRVMAGYLPGSPGLVPRRLGRLSRRR